MYSVFSKSGIINKSSKKFIRSLVMLDRYDVCLLTFNV